MGVQLNRLQAGDTWAFTTQAADYPASAGWTLTIYLVPRFTTPTQAAFTLTSVADPDDPDAHRFERAASQTAGLKPGQYGYWTRAGKGAEVYTLDATQWGGEVQILPDPSALAQGADGRSLAQKAIDDLEAALATYTASNGTVAEYEIDTGTGRRRMKFRAADEIDNLLSYWRRIRARELREDAIARGWADPRRGYVRLTPNG